VASAQTPYPDPLIYPNPPWCPTCYLAASIDAPSGTSNPALAHDKAARVLFGNWYIAGWAFVCNSGALPTRVEVQYRADDGRVVRVPFVSLVQHVYRPDVRQAFARGCPGVPDDAGFHVYFPQEQVPLGTRDLYIQLWRDGLRHTRHLIVTVE
jgi:hypothetical protein